jgi:hypothetical protein
MVTINNIAALSLERRLTKAAVLYNLKPGVLLCLSLIRNEGLVLRIVGIRT